MYIKKLEQGTFERPNLNGNASAQLTLLLQGVGPDSHGAIGLKGLHNNNRGC